MAALAEAFGRQAMFLGSVGVFTVGSIACATAPSVVTMLAGRTIQGIGGGGVISVNLITLSDFVPLRQRSKYQGLIQLVFALGTNIAPIIGGAMVDSSWRWYDHPKRSLLSLASANACEGYSTSAFRSVQSAW